MLMVGMSQLWGKGGELRVVHSTVNGSVHSMDPQFGYHFHKTYNHNIIMSLQSHHFYVEDHCGQPVDFHRQ